MLFSALSCFYNSTLLNTSFYLITNVDATVNVATLLSASCVPLRYSMYP